MQRCLVRGRSSRPYRLFTSRAAKSALCKFRGPNGSTDQRGSGRRANRGGSRPESPCESRARPQLVSGRAGPLVFKENRIGRRATQACTVSTEPGSAFRLRTSAVRFASADLPELRSGESGRLQLLRPLRTAAHRGAGPGRAEGRHRPLRRPRRLHGPLRADGSRGRARDAGALLCAAAGDARALRRHGREVHRRRGDGALRRTDGARGRSRAGRPRSPRHPRRDHRGRRAARAADRRQHG